MLTLKKSFLPPLVNSSLTATNILDTATTILWIPWLKVHLTGSQSELCWLWQTSSRHFAAAASCPAASFALVIFWLRAAAVVVAAGRGWRTEAGAGTTATGRLTDTHGWVRDGGGTGAWAGGDGTGTAAQRGLFLEDLGKVLVPL